MKVVIDISENDYWLACNYPDALIAVYAHAIKKGTPLPKGHGNLKDENEIKRMIEEAKVNSEHSKTFAENIIRFAPTIIEGETK